MNEMIPKHTVLELIETYREAVREFEIADHAVKRIGHIMNVMEAHMSPTVSVYGRSLDVKEGEKEIRRGFWRFVFKTSGAYQVMSPSKTKEIREWIEKSDLPAFDEENIMNQINGFRQNMAIMFDDYAKEVFDFLRPQYEQEQFKTNEKNRLSLQGKVIIDWCVVDGSLNTYKEPFLTALDNLFHILDKKSVPRDYEATFCNKLKEAVRTGKTDWHHSVGELKTEYFYVKWFKKGTIHITFLRDDLLLDFNQRAGNQTTLAWG